MSSVPILVIHIIPNISSVKTHKLGEYGIIRDTKDDVKLIFNFSIEPNDISIPIKSVKLIAQYIIYAPYISEYAEFRVLSRFEVGSEAYFLTTEQAQYLIEMHINDCMGAIKQFNPIHFSDSTTITIPLNASSMPDIQRWVNLVSEESKKTRNTLNDIE